MKFICDCMLGTLAKWLRILGYDTLFFKFIPDEDLKVIALNENRILLTKDRELAFNCGNSYFVKSESLQGQLKEVVKFFSLKKMKHSRCSVCNGGLALVDKESVKNLVPVYVFKTQNTFLQCKVCKRVYWNGTHSHRINSFIEKILRDIS